MVPFYHLEYYDMILSAFRRPAQRNVLLPRETHMRTEVVWFADVRTPTQQATALGGVPTRCCDVASLIGDYSSMDSGCRVPRVFPHDPLCPRRDVKAEKVKIQLIGVANHWDRRMFFEWDKCRGMYEANSRAAPKGEAEPGFL